MENKKQSNFTEWGKSFVVSIVPVTIVRLVLQLNFHISNAFLNTITLIGLVGLVHILRIKIKRLSNNDLPILLLMIIFFPAGLYYLWKYSRRSEKVKTIVTLIIVGLLLFGKIIAG